MRRFIASLFVVLSMTVGFGGVALAAQSDPFGDVCVPGTTEYNESPICEDARRAQTASNNSLYGPNGVITRAIGLVSIILGIAAVVVLIIAGFKYITAGGDANNIASAKNTAKYAVIGVVVALFARAIITFVLTKL